ncbi:hypothetical protein [Horticoccus sp. 23ND18S-11]
MRAATNAGYGLLPYPARRERKRRAAFSDCAGRSGLLGLLLNFFTELLHVLAKAFGGLATGEYGEQQYAEESQQGKSAMIGFHASILTLAIPRRDGVLTVSGVCAPEARDGRVMPHGDGDGIR